jgi:hypothetical protein
MPKYPDVTLAELCELLELKTGNWVSCPTMFRAARKIRVKPSKNQGSSQASIERVQKSRYSHVKLYWKTFSAETYL